MKKTLNILLISILILMGAYMLSGCTNNEQSNLPDNPATPIAPATPSNPSTPSEQTYPINPVLNLKTVTFFTTFSDKYYIKYKSDVEDMNGQTIKDAIIEISVDGKKMATNVQDAGYGIIVNETDIIYIMHNEKMYMIMEGGSSENNSNIFGDLNKNAIKAFIESGNKEINGTSYYFESFYDNLTEKTNKTIFYFDNNDKLKYMETIADGENSLIEIVEFNTNVKQSLFNIPSGYTEGNLY